MSRLWKVGLGRNAEFESDAMRVSDLLCNCDLVHAS
jgi:hypothetical protein